MAMGVPADDGLRAETAATRISPVAMGSSTRNLDEAQADEQMDETEQDAQDMEVGHIGSLEPDFDDFVSEMLLASVASTGRKYRREARPTCRRIVSEVYSPPRVTAEIKRGRHPHLVPGSAFDLTVMDPDDG